MESGFTGFVFSCIAESHEMTHPRSKVFKRVHSVVVVPATVAEWKEFGECSHDPRDIAFKLIDWFEFVLGDAQWWCFGVCVAG